MTGPSAVRLLLPHLPAEVGRAAVWHAWQACASFYVAVATVSPAAPRSAPSSAPAEIVDRAIATRDEHAIKFTEACLRENALRPRPAYLVAAQNAVGKLGDD